VAMMINAELVVRDPSSHEVNMIMRPFDTCS